MIILTLKTDNPEAEIGLFDDEKQLTYETWQAHRQLAETIHQKIDEILKQHNMSLQDVEGLVAYKGPGSFTGLRIGLSVANALAYGLSKPIVGATGMDWKASGMQRLRGNESDTAVMPEYGAPVHITKPKK